jgi:hypothetical protein
MEVYNANVVSYVRMIRRIVPQMKELGWGRVINIGGGLAIQPIKEQPHYNATLAARHNLSVSLQWCHYPCGRWDDEEPLNFTSQFRLRYSLGVTPVFCLKSLVKCC